MSGGDLNVTCFVSYIGGGAKHLVPRDTYIDLAWGGSIVDQSIYNNFTILLVWIIYICIQESGNMLSWEQHGIEPLCRITRI